jgi:hypothetical protein
MNATTNYPTMNPTAINPKQQIQQQFNATMMNPTTNHPSLSLISLSLSLSLKK